MAVYECENGHKFTVRLPMSKDVALFRPNTIPFPEKVTCEVCGKPGYRSGAGPRRAPPRRRMRFTVSETLLATSLPSR